MLGDDVYGVKNIVDNSDSYNIYDFESSERFLKHQEWNPSQLRLDLELSSDQYRTLIDQYGSMISVTMETIDLDQDGAMDKVAVKYVGSESEFTYEHEYPGGSVSWYIERFIEDDWDELRPLFEEAGKL